MHVLENVINFRSQKTLFGYIELQIVTGVTCEYIMFRLNPSYEAVFIFLSRIIVTNIVLVFKFNIMKLYMLD